MGRKKPLSNFEIKNAPRSKTVITCGGCYESYFSYDDMQKNCRCRTGDFTWLPDKKSS